MSTCEIIIQKDAERFRLHIKSTFGLSICGNRLMRSREGWPFRLEMWNSFKSMSEAEEARASLKRYLDQQVANKRDSSIKIR